MQIPSSSLNHPFIHHTHLPHWLRRKQRSPLGFGLAAVLKVLIGEEGEGTPDEDESVDTNAQTRGVRGGLGSGGGRGGEFGRWIPRLGREVLEAP